MPQEISYHEFCRLYVNDAMSIASLIIKKIDDPDGKGKEHRIHPLVDKDSVKAIAVSYTLDKVYKTYDVNHERGASIRTYLSFILQNCIITELKKAWTDVKRNHPELVKQKDAVRESLTEKRVVTGVKGRGSDLVKPEAHTYMYAGGASERKEQVIERMVACIQKLNPMDQVILNCWMYEKDNYVNKSLELLGYEITTKSQGMIRARLKRAQAALAKMMGGSKPDYRDRMLSRWNLLTGILNAAVQERSSARWEPRSTITASQRNSIHQTKNSYLIHTYSGLTSIWCEAFRNVEPELRYKG